MIPRCQHTDLPVDQCGHCLGHDFDEKPLRVSGPVMARYNGFCAHCGVRFHALSTVIALADIHGDGSSDEWCIADHTRDSTGGGR